MSNAKNPRAKKPKRAKAKKPIKWDTRRAEEQSAKNKALIASGETFASQKRTAREKSPSAYKETR
ncbi:hypothetical protein ACTXJX_11970 [Glutamicibacter ardleyensis]|uniref:hypothetical protein n=1 Tax=Glutamicibacter ardleyensis TaxID=225894 RepID=UPI003FD68E06